MITKSHLVSGLAPGRELGRELGIWVPEARPAGAAIIRTYPMAGNFFHPPHPHAQAHHPIDFINPDSRLLGKKNHVLTCSQTTQKCFSRRRAELHKEHVGQQTTQNRKSEINFSSDPD